MIPSLTWIDHDERERDRMRRILALFRERDTRDELGLGAVRDSIADHLFPGTSTIQTRLRYMLIIPWVYRWLEDRHVPSREIATRARELEVRLIDVLAASGNPEGVIGIEAREGLKRLPSSTYWSGLKAWGICLFNGSQDAYHQALGAVYRARSAARRKTAEGDLLDLGLSATWRNLPTPPNGFPESLDLRVTLEEADFLIDRIVSSFPDSLLAFLAIRRAFEEVDYPWQHPLVPRLPQSLRDLLLHGQRFSNLMFGAVVLYNIMLAEAAERDDLVADHRSTLERWAGEIDRAELAVWPLTSLWNMTQHPQHKITPRTVRFVSDWLRLVLADTANLADNKEARTLVRVRELALKGPRARLANPVALSQWSGSAGLIRLDFRWRIVRGYLRDLRNAA